jgi:voltage-gated potassium channel Kch
LIGAGIDLHAIAARPAAIFLVVLCLVLLKGALVVALEKLAKMPLSQSVLFGVSLAQGGEFAFVLLGISSQSRILDAGTTQLLTAAVAVSMALAPLLISGTIRWALPHLARQGETRQPDEVGPHHDPVLVIGIGRFGLVVVRLLRANGVNATVLDYDSEQIEVMERFGLKSHFGDGTRLDLLHAAGIGRVKLLVIAVDDQESALRIVEDVRREYPKLKIYARAFDRVHGYKLLHKGADEVTIETGGSAVNFGIDILRELGFEPRRAFRQGQVFRRYNERSLKDLAKLYHETDRTAFVQNAKQRLDALENLLKNDRVELNDGFDRFWESPPRSRAQVDDQPAAPS